MPIIPATDPLATSVVEAIHRGDLETLKRLLAEHADLATASIRDAARCDALRTLLHVAANWPGHFPEGAATVKALIQAGADVNARFAGRHSETPLHWAASSDDVAVLDALLDAGADIEAPGAVIAGGTPLDDAVAFGQWRAARRLVARGARVRLWHAAALGLMDRVAAFFAEPTPPARDEVTDAFWQACHGGQRHAAEYLFERGAQLNWIGYDHLTPLDVSRRSGAEALADWLRARGAMTATELH